MDDSHRLSLARIAEAARTIDPVFLHSPLLRCEPLFERLAIKVETINPVGSFKGRGADFFVAKAAGTGPLVCASAGNFGQAMAYACRGRGIELTVFVAHGASSLKVAGIAALGARVVTAGADFESAKHAARAWAAETGVRFVEDGREPEISEGAGTIAVELLASGDTYDAVVVPVGDGALISGMARWLRAEAPAMCVIGVCSRGAPAMYESWRRGRLVVGDRADTIADGIAVRSPIDVAFADMVGLVDDIVLVDDAALIDAMRAVHARTGLIAEPSAVAGLAAILAAPSRYAGMRIATVLTGGNVTAEQRQEWQLHSGS